MFNEDEIFILKELIETEIEEVEEMFLLTNVTDKLTLVEHKQKLFVILEKLNNA